MVAMPSPRETILAALHARLSALPATALRAEVLPERVPAEGLLIMRDGEPGEPELTLSPLAYHYQYRAEIGQRIFHGRRWGRALGACDEPSCCQLLEPAGEDLGGHRWNVVAQLAEAPRPVPQVPDDVRRPGPADHAHALREKARLRRRGRSVLAHFQGHGARPGFAAVTDKRW